MSTCTYKCFKRGKSGYRILIMCKKMLFSILLKRCYALNCFFIECTYVISTFIYKWFKFLNRNTSANKNNRYRDRALCKTGESPNRASTPKRSRWRGWLVVWVGHVKSVQPLLSGPQHNKYCAEIGPEYQ